MIDIITRVWQDFLDSLNSDGGHILLLALMVWIGMVGMQYSIPKADDLYVGAFTALLILLKSAGSNKTRRDGASTTSTTSTTSTPPTEELEHQP